MAANVGYGGGRSRWRIAVWATLGTLMLLPVSAALVTDDMDWSAFDFALVGGLLLGAGSVFELSARHTGSRAYLAGVGVAVAAAIMLFLVTGAVGIIGSEDHDANLLYAGVLATAVIGTAIARFRAAGMARAMLAAALVQASIAAVALVAGWGSSSDPAWPLDILGATALFVAVWLTSGWLFQRATPRPTLSAR